MPKLQVKVINKFGTFDGAVVLEDNTTPEKANETMLSLIGGVNTINSLSLETADGSATVFPETVLRESVFNIKVVF